MEQPPDIPEDRKSLADRTEEYRGQKDGQLFSTVPVNIVL